MVFIQPINARTHYTYNDINDAVVDVRIRGIPMCSRCLNQFHLIMIPNQEVSTDLIISIFHRVKRRNIIKLLHSHIV